MVNVVCLRLVALGMLMLCAGHLAVTFDSPVAPRDLVKESDTAERALVSTPESTTRPEPELQKTSKADTVYWRGKTCVPSLQLPVSHFTFAWAECARATPVPASEPTRTGRSLQQRSRTAGPPPPPPPAPAGPAPLSSSSRKAHMCSLYHDPAFMVGPPGPAAPRCMAWHEGEFARPFTAAALDAAVAGLPPLQCKTHRSVSEGLRVERRNITGLVEPTLPGEAEFRAPQRRLTGCGVRSRFARPTRLLEAFEGDDATAPAGVTPTELVALLHGVSEQGTRPLLVSGDSYTREVFMRLVSFVRGQGRLLMQNSWRDLVYVVRRRTDTFSVLRGKFYSPHSAPHYQVQPTGDMPRCVVDDPDDPCLFMFTFAWHPYGPEENPGLLHRGFFPTRRVPGCVPPAARPPPMTPSPLARPAADHEAAGSLAAAFPRPCEVAAAFPNISMPLPPLYAPRIGASPGATTHRPPPLPAAKIPALHLYMCMFWARMRGVPATTSPGYDRALNAGFSFADALRTALDGAVAKAAQEGRPRPGPARYQMMHMTLPSWADDWLIGAFATAKRLVANRNSTAAAVFDYGGLLGEISRFEPGRWDRTDEWHFGCLILHEGSLKHPSPDCRSEVLTMSIGLLAQHLRVMLQR